MKISVSIDIQRKPEQVFPWIEDPDKARLWQKSVIEGKILKATPEKTGTTFQETIEENGKRLEMEGRITDYISNELIAFHLESRIHRVNVQYTIMENETISSVVVESSIRWKFPMSLLCVFIGKRIKVKILQQTQLEFSELKRRCESNVGD